MSFIIIIIYSYVGGLKVTYLHVINRRMNYFTSFLIFIQQSYEKWISHQDGTITHILISFRTSYYIYSGGLLVLYTNTDMMNDIYGEKSSYGTIGVIGGLYKASRDLYLCYRPY